MSFPERHEALFSGEVSSEVSPAPKAEYLRRQLRSARQHPDALVRLETIKGAIQEAEGVDLTSELLEFLGDPDELVRVEVLQALEGNSEPQIVVHLLGLAVADPDWLARGWAVTCLSYAEYPWLNEFLWRVYKRDTSHFVKVRALGALVFRGVSEAAPLLMQYLASQNHRLVINAAQELAAGVGHLPQDLISQLLEQMRERLGYWRSHSAWAIVEALERSLDDVRKCLSKGERRETSE
jgi:HEAT repeat protein